MMNVVGFRRVSEELRSDMTLTLTNSMSSTEIQAKIDLLPRYINENLNLTIQFSDGTYVPGDGLSYSLGGFSGPGTLTIQGNPTESGLHTNQAVIFTLGLTHATNGIVVVGCSCRVVVKNMRFNRSATAGLLYQAMVVSNCFDVSLHGCCFDSQNQSCRGCLSYFSNLKFYNNYSGANNALLYGYACSNNIAWDNDDISSGNRPSYAYIADHASGGYYGTSPSSVTAVAAAVNGGRIWT